MKQKLDGMMIQRKQQDFWGVGSKYLRRETITTARLGEIDRTSVWAVLGMQFLET